MANRRTRGMRLGIVLAVSALPSLACLTPRGGGKDIDVTRAALSASLGAYEGGGATRVEYADDQYVELRSNGPYGAVMIGLSVDEGLGSIEDGGTASADVIGCGGPSEGDWYWDRHTRAVRVQVEPIDARTRRVSVEADWSDGSFARATFDYEIR